MAAFQSLLSFGFKGTSKIAHFAHQSEGSPVATVLLAARHQWTLVFFRGALKFNFNCSLGPALTLTLTFHLSGEHLRIPWLIQLT